MNVWIMYVTVGKYDVCSYRYVHVCVRCGFVNLCLHARLCNLQ